MITARDIVTSLGVTVLAVLATTLVLTGLGPDWSAYAPATCTATRCFCEFPRIGSLILQPADSFSSYGYVFAGTLMIVLARGDHWRSGFDRNAAAFFGITAIIVGLGSVLLHATLSLWGQFFDVTGMYFTGGFMLVCALARWRQLSEQQAITLYTALLAVLLALLYLVPEVRRWLFAAVLIAAIIVEMGFARPLRPGVKTRFYVTGIATKALAFTIWNLDQRGIVCAPHSLLQGHAAWHLLGATALFLTYLYYRSERQASAPG